MSDKQQTYYNMVAQNLESTVVSQYIRDAYKMRDAGYQSEADLEREFIKQLQSQAYEYVSIKSEADLIANLRRQLEKLNNYTFTDGEWDKFFVSTLANPNQSIIEKTITIQEDYIKNLTRDDGSIKNIYLIKKDNIHDNNLQVINQYATENGQRSNRYDVTVLVNGLPLVHIELKRRGVAIQEAFNQIMSITMWSFWNIWTLQLCEFYHLKRFIPVTATRPALSM